MKSVSQIPVNRDVRAAIGDIFDGHPLDPKLFEAPWIWILLGIFIGIALISCAAAIILIYSRKSRGEKNARLDAPVFRCIVNISDDIAKVLLPAPSPKGNDLPYIDMNLKGFTSLFTPVSSSEVESWLKRLPKRSAVSKILDVEIGSEGLEILFGPERVSGAKHAQLFLTGSDSSTGALFLDFAVCPNLSLALQARPYPRYMDYRTYLRAMRHLLKGEGTVQFTYIGLTSNPESGRMEKQDIDISVPVSRLAEYLARMQTKGTYMVRVDDSSLMIIDTRRASDVTREKRVNGIYDDVSYFLKINNIESRYTPLVGSVNADSASLEPLGSYPKLTRENGEARLIRDSVLRIEGLKTDPLSWRRILEKSLDNRTIRVFFTPYFTLPSGEITTYSISIEPQLSTGPIDSETFYSEISRLDLFDRYLDTLAELIEPKLPQERKLILLLHTHLSTAEKLTDSEFKERLGDTELIALFEHTEIEKFSSEGLKELIARLNSAGIQAALSMNNIPPLIDDSLLSLFSLFIVKSQNGKSLVANPSERINTLSTIEYLKPFQRPIALEGLSKSEETYFALIHGVKLVSSPSLGEPSSIIEGPSSESLSIIETINKRQYVRR